MRTLFLLAVLASGVVACDHGLEPPEASTGAIRGVITYLHAEAWPPSDSLRDLRFFALPFVPRDSLDFFRDLNLLVFSEDQLRKGVSRDSFFVGDVDARVYVYSGVAYQFSANLLDWRPLGLYDAEGGIFEVRPGDTTDLFITVDLQNPPPFPPASNR